MHSYAAFAKPPVVTIDGVDWINPSVNPDTDLDPLARDMLPLVRGKQTTVLGVLDGPSFRKWWDYICGCTEEESIISIRMNFSDGWRDARSAIVHVEDGFHFQPVDRKALRLKPRDDLDVEVPTDSFICVSVDILKEPSPSRGQSEQMDSAEVLIRAITLYHIVNSLNYWVYHTGQKFSGTEAWEKSRELKIHDDNEGFQLGRLIIANIYRFSANILLLDGTPDQAGYLKMASGSNGSLFRRAQSSLARINYEHDQLPVGWK